MVYRGPKIIEEKETKLSSTEAQIELSFRICGKGKVIVHATAVT